MQTSLYNDEVVFLGVYKWGGITTMRPITRIHQSKLGEIIGKAATSVVYKSYLLWQFWLVCAGIKKLLNKWGQINNFALKYLWC